MQKDDREDLAHMCRCQAALASTREARSVLIEMAERYECGGHESVTNRHIRLAKQFE